MAPPDDERRGSFARFVLNPAPRGEGAKRGDVSASSAWERLAHSAALLGYGQLASFVTVVFVAWMSGLAWTEEAGDGVPRLDNWTVLNGMLLPFMVFYAASTCFHIYQASAYPDAGYSRLAMVPLCLGLGFVPAFYGIQAAVLSTDTDSTYYGLDWTLVFVFVLVFVVFDISIRNKLTLNKIQHDEEKPDPASENVTVAADDGQLEQQTLAPNKTAGLIGLLFDLLPFLAGIGIAFAYPFVVLPLFFSSSVPTRIAICLFLHPVLLEAAEAFGRGQKADQVARALRAGEITLEVAERRIAQGSMTDFGIKQVMAFFRRFMLLNMGSPDATLIALVATAIEEAASRGFLVQIDTAIRALRGLPELEGDDLQLQRLVWMCDTNQSCIAEFNAILTSTFAHVLLQRHAVIFAIGYEANQVVSTAMVFVQLLVELTLELLVDNTAMWAESEHGIPVTRYFTHADGFAVFGVHASNSILFMCNALYAFLRHPHFSSCASNNVCDCLDQATYQEWVGEACATSNVSTSPNTNNATAPRNSTSTEDPTLDLLDDVDFIAVILALLSGFAALALIVLAVLFARYRKRQQVVVGLVRTVSVSEVARLAAEAQNKELKESLQQASKMVQECISEAPMAQLRQFAIKFAELKFTDEIGHGAFGVVWKGDFRGKPVAIKTVRVTKVTKSVVKDFMKEITLMAPLRHDCLVRLIGGCWEDGPDNLCLVLEYCGRGSLKGLLVDQHAGHSWETPYFAIAHGVASCLRYFHHEQPSGEPIIHRDLKPDNVMICDDFSPRVGDLGESTRFDQQEALRRIAEQEGDSMLTMTMVGTCGRGTPLYTAPEVLAGRSYDKAVDVYSFGITLLEIGCSDHHFVAKQFVGVSRFTATQGWRPKPTKELVEMRPGIWKLVQECWHADPKQRPSFVEVASSVKALDPTLEPGPSSTLISTPMMILDDDSAKALPTQESLVDKQRRAKARYQGLSRDEVDLRLLEAESSRDEAEASRDEMARRLRDAEERIELLQRSKQQGGSDPMLHQTMTNEKGISLRVTFEYDPDQRASVLGEGAFGTVYAVKSTLDSKSYAMKRLVALKNAGGSVDSVAMNEMLEEVQKLSRLRSEHFVHYVTSSVTREYLFVVMERLHGVEFRDLVVARKALNIPFRQEHIESWLKQLAAGLSYLHDKAGLIHQDLHNGNVMIIWDPLEAPARAELVAEDDELLVSCTRVKILDLGLSTFKSEQIARTLRKQLPTRSMRTQKVGGHAWDVEINASEVCGFKAIRAPEMWALGADGLVRYGAKTDVWALALLVCEAVLCNPIEEWYNDRATLQSFGKDQSLQQAKIEEVTEMSPFFGEIVRRMLAEEPRLRLSAQQVLYEVTYALRDAHPRRDVESPVASGADALWERYELEGLPAIEGSVEALQTLASFADVLPAERSEMRLLLLDEVGGALLQQPAHIGGGVAMLRLVRDPDMPAIERARKMLDLRRELNSAAKYEEIRAQGLSLHTLPGSAKLREATFQTNELIGADARGDVVVYERWGAVDPKILMETMPVEAYARWDAYRWEARAMVLDTLSPRERRVVYFANVIDVRGTKFEHRKLLGYVKAFSGGAAMSVPEMRSTTHFIRSNSFVSAVYGLAKKTNFVTDNHRATTFFISGDKPFETSTDFAARFGRHVLPTTVGGTLQVGDASVPLPTPIPTSSC